MCGEELTGYIRTIDFEAFLCAGEFLKQSEVVKYSRNVEKFMVETEVLLAALLSREQIHPDGMVEQQIRGMLAQQICGFFRKQRIGYDEVRG
jgi:hypothetical protein